jgi:NDP-sugar pyrophosphorylase family protein
MTQIECPVAILAGGLATRLRPLTETVPKSLIEINGEPFIAHQLRLLRSAGLRHVVLCTGYLGEMIQDYVGDGARFGLRVEYSFDGPKLLGTAGALRRARHLLGDRFLVVYGDSYLPCDYRAVEATAVRLGRKALMTVYRNEGQFDLSNVEFADGRIIAYDKRNRTDRMHHIDYGLGWLATSVLDALPEGQPCDLADVYAELLSQDQLAAYEVATRFYEIGSVSGIEEIGRFLLAGEGSLLKKEN